MKPHLCYLQPVLLTLIVCQPLQSPFCLANPSGSSNSSQLPMSSVALGEKTEGEAQVPNGLGGESRKRECRNLPG